MLSILQARYARLEASLDRLLESIASYNPSIEATDELLAADEETNKSIEELTRHHDNYARILALRRESHMLDEQIKSGVRMISSTRKSLLRVPSLANDSNGREAKASDVLDYARFISKTTMPHTSDQAGIAQEDLHKVIESSNALSQEARASNGDHDNTGGQQLSMLSQEAKAMLDPVAQLPFVPWPTQDIINNGALGEIQSMLEQGRDPNSVRSREEIEASERAKAEEDARRTADEAEKARARRKDMMHLGNVARSGPSEDVFDPDDM